LRLELLWRFERVVHPACAVAEAEVTRAVRVIELYVVRQLAVHFEPLEQLRQSAAAAGRRRAVVDRRLMIVASGNVAIRRDVYWAVEYCARSEEAVVQLGGKLFDTRPLRFYTLKELFDTSS